MRLSGYIFLVVSSLFFIASCADSDDFSSNSSLKLTLGEDTLRFDTVFTTVGSATRHFKVYNRNNNSLTIESIEIMNPQKSGFRMNIDGETGTRISNVDILKKDSIYGFFEVTVDPLNVNNPVLIRDSVRFVTNGNVQYLYLEAIGRDVYKWTGKIFTSDTILFAEKPYLIYDSIRVDENVLLTIKENVELYFHDKASVEVYGTLKVEGKTGEPVVFRGDRLDYFNGPVPYDNVPGLWQGIVFHPQSYNNHLENAIVRNTVTCLNFLPSDLQYKKASLVNVVLHNAQQNILASTNCDIDVSNTQLTNARVATLALHGGRYSFLHCTIANYYRWEPRFTPSVVIDNKESPFTQCDFINSIVYGSLSKELLFENEPENYRFQNCLLKVEEVNNPNFIDVIWNEDPEFKDIGTNRYYYCDFSLKSTSPARDRADRAYSLMLPNDLKGISRLNDADPDIGCYEYSVD